MLTERAVNDIARAIIDHWDDWEAIAGQDAQSVQTPQAWRDTMIKQISKAIRTRMRNGRGELSANE